MRLKLFSDNQKYDIFGYHFSNETSISSILYVGNKKLFYIVLYIICLYKVNLLILNQYHYQL